MRLLHAASAMASGLAFAALRLWSFWPGRGGADPHTYADTAEYLRVSRLPLLSARFFTDDKPFGYPLVLKLTDGSLAATVWLQFGVSLLSWLFLAAVAGSVCSHRAVRRLAPACVLLLGTSWQVAQWDTLMLTESLTLSAFVVLVGVALLVVQRPTPLRVAAIVAVSFVLTALRDTNGVEAGVVLLVVAGVVAAARHRRASLAVLVAVAACGCVALVAGTASVRRWEILVADQIRRRVVHDPAELAYFRRHGMPYRANLARIIFSDTRAPLPVRTFERDPRLTVFMPWFLAHGRATYDGYLIRHPRAALVQPAEQYTLLLSDSGVDTYHAPRFRRLPAALNAIAYPSRGTFSLDAELLVVAGGLLGLVKGAGRRTWVVPYALILFSLPLAIVVWDGEPSEVPRHALLVGVSARLGAVVAASLLLDAAAAALRAPAIAPRGPAARRGSLLLAQPRRSGR